MSKLLNFTILSLSTLLLSACGGGSSKSSNNDGPLAPYDTFGSEQNQGRTLSTAAGFDGDISVLIDDDNDLDFELIYGRVFMDIRNVRRAETYSFNCPDGTNAKVSFFENYAQGSEEIVAIINGRRINCRSTYETGLFPSTIGSSASISDLIVEWDASDAGEYITTNCPDESDEINLIDLDLEPDPSICETGLFLDATVTEDNGDTHLISYESVSIPD